MDWGAVEEVTDGAGDVEVEVTVGPGDVDGGEMVVDVVDVLGVGGVVVDDVDVDVVEVGALVVDVIDVVEVDGAPPRTQSGQNGFVVSPASQVSPRSASTMPLPHPSTHARPQKSNSASSTRTSRPDAARGGSKRSLNGIGTRGKKV
jgi:hypothetical protein